MSLERRPRGRGVEIGPARRSEAHGTVRVAAPVDGATVWFESPDAALEPAAEAFGSAFLVPALHQGMRLRLAQPVDPEWLANLPPLLAILREWWRYPGLLPEVPVERAAAAPPAPGTALFFSGGVDSFYSLLHGATVPDRLVTVHGFDVPLADGCRGAGLESCLREVAAARGCAAVWVRTNLREHPLLEPVSWDRSHGGGLMAVGHLLRGVASEVLISSSVAGDREQAWGSHWRTDPLFSSARVRFREVGMERRRLQKLRLIANEPLVRRHLRVCWEHRDAGPNCSRCPKCLMTRLVLADCGVLGAFPGFAGLETLARDLDACRLNRGHQGGLEELAASPRLPRDVRRAAAALARRSRRLQGWPVRMRRALLRRVLSPWQRSSRPGNER